MKETKRKLSILFKKKFNHKPVSITRLTPHGSTREYFKVESSNNVAIGTKGSDKKENRVFIKLAEHLASRSIPVPSIYGFTKDYEYYLQAFVGDEDLFSTIENSPKKAHLDFLKKTIDLLHDFQTRGIQGWNFKNSYPFPSFNTDEVVRDFVRFKKYFLTNLGIKFSETSIDKERDILTDLIDKIPKEDFVMMHRDFQTRNILNNEGKYILIDFQSIRHGPPHYDLVSILCQSQNKYSDSLKKSIIDYYLSKNPKVNTREFIKNLQLMSIVRLVQSLGSYVVAGLQDGKKYYIESIPRALDELGKAITKTEKNHNIKLPYLEKLVDSSKLKFNSKYKK